MKYQVGNYVQVVESTAPFFGERGLVTRVISTHKFPYEVKLNSGMLALFSELELAPASLGLPFGVGTQILASTKTVPAGAVVTQEHIDKLYHDNFYGGGNSQSQRERDQARWKSEGRCQECGELLPMSIHGLGECPHHPKPLPPGFKQ